MCGACVAVGSGQQLSDIIEPHDASNEGAIEGELDLPAREATGEVEQRARGRGDGQSLVDPTVPSGQDAGAVDHDAGRRRRAIAGYEYVEKIVTGHRHVPEPGRRAASQQRALAHGQEGRRLGSEFHRAAVAEGKDRAVERMEGAALDKTVDHVVAQACRLQLPS